MTASSRSPANRPDPPEARRDADGDAAQAAEDRLESLMSDPIVQLLMERDGVERAVLLRMVRTVRSRSIAGREGDSTPGDPPSGD